MSWRPPAAKKMIGIDIVKITRIKTLAQKPAFLARVFTENEIAYYRAAGERAETLAGMYALKEAAAKALGTGFTSFGLRDIEITHNESGAPNAAFTGKAGEIFEKTGAARAECSISHEKEYAVAVCRF